MFSLQDLVQVHQGTLLPEVQAIHRVFLTHIKSDCQVNREECGGWVEGREGGEKGEGGQGDKCWAGPGTMYVVCVV